MTEQKNTFREETVEQKHINKKTFWGFAFLLLFFVLAVFSWNYITRQPEVDGVASPLRTNLENTENIFSAFFSSKRLTKEYPIEQAVKNVRVNGLIGMRNVIDTARWQLKIVRGNKDTLFLKFSELLQLPKTEVIFDFKCVEGWSQITHWGGIRFSDFISHYQLQALAKNYKYVGMYSVDKGYYVGIDMPSMMQPQTLLCYEMNDALLPMKQGYPLRLIIPVKYGIKHIKQLGTIYFSNTKPKDYWSERGYDYFAGL